MQLPYAVMARRWSGNSRAMANSQSNQPPVLGEEVVIRVQGSRWFITKRQWPARLVACLVGVPEEDNGLTMRP